MKSQLRLPLIHCNQGGIHQNEKINQICLQNNCINKGDFLLCIACSDQQHENHETIPAKLLLNEIIISLDKSSQNLYKKFEIQRQEAMENFQQLKLGIYEQIDSLEQALKNIYEQIQQNLKDHVFQFSQKDVKEFVALLENNKNISEIKEELKQLLFKICIQSPNSDSSENLLKNAKKSTTLFEMNEKEIEINNILQGLQKDITNIFNSKKEKIENIKNINYSNLFEQEQNNQQDQVELQQQEQQDCNGFQDYSFDQKGDIRLQNTFSFSQKQEDDQKEEYQITNQQNQQDTKHENGKNQQQDYPSYYKYLNFNNTTKNAQNYNHQQQNPKILVQDQEQQPVQNQNIKQQIQSEHSPYSDQDRVLTSQSQPQFYQNQQQKQQQQQQQQHLHRSQQNFKSQVNFQQQQQNNQQQQQIKKNQSATSFKFGQSSQNSFYKTGSPNRSIKSYNIANNSTYSNFYQIEKPDQKFEFSDFYKHEQIKIQNNDIVIKNQRYINQDQVYRVQLMTPTLEDSLPKIQTWSFQILECLPAWIGFGVAHIEQMKEKDFQLYRQDFSLNTQSLNDHGTYIVTSNGFAFKHLRRPERTNFCLTKGDIVTMRFDPFLNYLIYYKNHDYSNPYNLEFKSELGNKLYPCVILWYPNDEVKLLL